MTRIVVLGAGICGLAAGLLLHRDGHEVTVLERDPEPAPVSVAGAWESWPRDGVTQFRQPHYLQSRGRIMLEDELPDVVAALDAIGGLRFDALCAMPPSIADRTPRDGDERFTTITARRPVLEQAFGRAADAETGLAIRRGVRVRELLMTAYDGTPHVSGVRTDSGEKLRADLVVDAMGRRSQLPGWVESAGAHPVHEEVEDSGFIYYTRYFRARNGKMPEFRAPPVTPLGTFSLLTLPADNHTWSVTVFTSAGDRPFKRLRDRDLWTAVVAACPRHAQWLDGEPTTDVLPMGGIVDRYRRFRVDDKPVATGIASVGDAWACTNPSNGRGMTLGLIHVQRLRDVIRAHLHDLVEFAEVWDAVTEAELAPWYRDNVAEDRIRMGEIEALRQGHEPCSRAELLNALRVAVLHDADAFRAQLAARSCLTRLEETFANQEFVERILEIARDTEPPPLAGPNRSQLLALLDSRSHHPVMRHQWRTQQTRLAGPASPGKRTQNA
jgi:2-polyprenyl-6-methoxyphenol hydroxylase-like FAD-dependent oxidoreductase